MIAKQQLLVDGLANRGHTKGVPQTGDAAKGVPNTGAHAAGKKRQPNTGKGKKGVPKTGKAKKGPTHHRYIEVAGRPECETAGCTALKRSNGRTLAGMQSWRKTCCPACK